MTYDELIERYDKQTYALAHARSALSSAKKNRDYWKERCELYMARLKLEKAKNREAQE